MFHERELGMLAVWNDTLQTGKPIPIDLVSEYITFAPEDQKKAGIAGKQAPGLLNRHLKGIIAPMRTRMHCTSSTLVSVVLDRDIALFSVAFRMTK